MAVEIKVVEWSAGDINLSEHNAFIITRQLLQTSIRRRRTTPLWTPIPILQFFSPLAESCSDPQNRRQSYVGSTVKSETDLATEAVLYTCF